MAAPAASAVLVVMVMLVVVAMMIMMAMSMGMGLCMGVGMSVSMAVMMVMTMVVVAVMGAALGPEGTLHRRGDAVLAAHQLGPHRIVLHIEGVARNLGEAMLASEMPGEPHQPERVLGPHLQEPLRRGLHLNEGSILETQGIAIVDGGFHVEIEQDLGPALSGQPCLTAVAGRMVERDRVDDAVGFHGGLADDGGDAGHGFVSARE